jgi:hypothetical protein
MLSLDYTILHVMYCALRVGYCIDGYMLHGSTLPYTILVVEVLPFYD